MLAAPFLWDDHRLLATLPAQLDPRALLQPSWLGEPGEGAQPAYFRPLTTLSFVIDRRCSVGSASGVVVGNAPPEAAAVIQ